MRDKKKEMRLNEAVREWKRLGAADEARRDALWGDIFLLAFEMFDDGSLRVFLYDKYMQVKLCL